MIKRTLFTSIIVSALGLLFMLIGLMDSSSSVLAESTVAAPQHKAGTIPLTVVLTPTKDNTLYESDTGALSNGAGAYFFVGKTNTGAIRRGLLAFDIASRLPAGATVVSATLQMNMSKSVAGATAVGLHRALADWGEGTSNDTNRGGGVGTAATTGDATWLHTFHDMALWSTLGGDFVPTATVTTSVDGEGIYIWPSTPSLVAEIQQWLETPATNFGWVVVGDESTSRTAKRFDSRENATAASRPQLTVVYTISGTTPNLVYLPLIQK